MAVETNEIRMNKKEAVNSFFATGRYRVFLNNLHKNCKYFILFTCFYHIIYIYLFL